MLSTSAEGTRENIVNKGKANFGRKALAWVGNTVLFGWLCHYTGSVDTPSKCLAPLLRIGRTLCFDDFGTSHTV